MNSGLLIPMFPFSGWSPTFCVCVCVCDKRERTHLVCWNDVCDRCTTFCACMRALNVLNACICLVPLGCGWLLFFCVCVFICPVWPKGMIYSCPTSFFSCSAPSAHCVAVFSLAGPQWIPLGPSMWRLCLFGWFASTFLWICVFGCRFLCLCLCLGSLC